VGTIVGVAMAVLLGPDNRLTTGPHDLGTDQVALVTRPEVLRWAGPTVTVTAELPDDQPVFLGLGNTVDVADYLSRTGFERVDSLDLPWRVSTTTVSGKRYLPAAPMAVDWWVAQNAGQGGAQITVPRVGRLRHHEGSQPVGRARLVHLADGTIARQQSSIDGVRFAQQWRAEPGR
jgi:hypothetical protein